MTDTTQSTQSFSFPRFSLLRREDTATHEVVIGEVTVGDEVLVVRLFRKKGLLFKADFLLSRVSSGDKEVWSFTKHSLLSATEDRVALLAKGDGDDIVIAFLQKGRNGAVADVIPFSEFLSHEPSDVGRKIEHKLGAAAYLRRDYMLSGAERAFRRHEKALKEEERRVAQEKAEVERKAAAERKRKARAELVSQIRKRPALHVFTRDGRHRYGPPVTEDEWRSLPHGMSVVLVEEYDEETLTATEPTEAFKVQKENGKAPRKGFSIPVSLAEDGDGSLATVSSSVPQSVNTILVDMAKRGTFSVLVYESMDDVRKSRSAGLNSGTFVTAHDKRGEDGRYEVYSSSEEELKTVGIFTPIG